MKKHWPWILTALIVFEVLFSFRTRHDKEGDYAHRQFGRLPALLGGRVQPVESIARNSLLIIRGTSKVPLEGNGAGGKWGKWEELDGALTERKWYQFSKRPAKLKPAQWLLEVFANPEVSDTRYIFRIHHPELLGELKLHETGVDKSGLRFYSFAQLEPHLSTIEKDARAISETKAERRTPYQKAVMILRHSLQLYLRLKNSVRPQMAVKDDALFFDVPTPELVAAMELPTREPASYSYNEVQPKFDAAIEHVRNAMRESETNWTVFGNFIGEYQAYESLKSIWRDEWNDSFAAELQDYDAALKANDAERLASFQARYDHQQSMAYPHLVGPGVNVSDYTLRLQSVEKTDELVREGRSLVVVALVGKHLHVRIFDADGNLLVNKSESELTGGNRVRLLREELQGGDLPDLTKFSKNETREMIKRAAFVSGLLEWENMGTALVGVVKQRVREVPGTAHSYAAMMASFRKGNVADFNRHLGEYQTALNTRLPGAVKFAGVESVYNQFASFQRSMFIYLLGFIFVLAFWLKLSENLRRAAFQLITVGLIVHTAGLIFRMYIGGYAPVTNLYSSAVFVGWAAVLIGVILELIFRNGIGIATSAGIGYITLIIAHHLAMEGDTMEMMRAVLDTNFWLSTHVTIITIGYAATFLAGKIAIAYVIGALFTLSISNEISKILSRMVYGIICFATLFSFFGTVLGGLWADYSWGRFWGWDPKENGALLIVIWNATILHLRWGGMIRDRGLMNCAIFGNVVTAFSWFGVNMLGIGLHSYGFMDAAFKWLSIYSVSQLALIVLGSLPFGWWLSVRSGKLVPSGYKPAA